ncbi:symporter [Bifidobacterium dolichotidis]|uniref:Symporter n=1 Tax=Bifidobacterium dolichotidis TaxID=2306976 RepID=A0A430FRL4_9BIFI|nr:acyltransferase family protein [Bifidobacterium dolichotidis]RSX55504.1 symporter [Bifidobacterium dolichotidis]
MATLHAATATASAEQITNAATPSPTTTKVRRKTTRNSSIELLRIISMFMIVAFHYTLANDDTEWLTNQATTFTKFVYEFVFMGGGWVANFIFFAISTWFLLDRTKTLKQNLKSIWILDRQILFWSLHCSPSRWL